VYPWTEIQAAHREMEADKNMYVISDSHLLVIEKRIISGKIIVEVV
jgi:hypothetical protein